MNPVPTLGYPSITAAVKGLLEEGKSVKEVSELIKISEYKVRLCVSRGSYNKKRTQIQVPIEISDLLHREANARGMSTLRLANRLLIAIAKDNLVNAILDDSHDDEKGNGK